MENRKIIYYSPYNEKKYAACEIFSSAIPCKDTGHLRNRIKFPQCPCVMYNSLNEISVGKIFSEWMIFLHLT